MPLYLRVILGIVISVVLFALLAVTHMFAIDGTILPSPKMDFAIIVLLNIIFFIYFIKKGFDRYSISFAGFVIGLCVVVIGVLNYRYYFVDPQWDAVFYRTDNRGRNPLSRGPFQTESECLATAQKVLDQKEVVIDGSPATQFFCGKFCSNTAWGPGGSVIDEYECVEGKVPHLNSD